MVNWLDIRRKPLEAIEHGISATETPFGETHTGPVSFDAMDYPVAEILPETTERASGTEWTHRIIVNLFFQRERGLDYVDDILHPVADVLDATLAELGTVDCINNYAPTRIEDYAGELDNTSVLLVSITLEATTLIDPGEF